jgi:hypothetical protein
VCWFESSPGHAVILQVIDLQDFFIDRVVENPRFFPLSTIFSDNNLTTRMTTLISGTSQAKRLHAWVEDTTKQARKKPGLATQTTFSKRIICRPFFVSFSKVLKTFKNTPTGNVQMLHFALPFNFFTHKSAAL